MPFRILLFFAALLASAGAPAATFVVTSAADTAGSSCGNSCTLRQAITAANATPAADTINFAITVPPRGEILIAPTSSLPTITQPLTINGYSQNGTRVNDDPEVSNAVLRIRVDGNGAPAESVGFAACAPNVTIRGLAVTRFERGVVVGLDGPVSCAAGATSILGNFIGLNAAGTAALPNGLGILATTQVSIGSGSLADRNVVVGFNAIRVQSAGVAGSTVSGNLIGTDKTGTLDPAETAVGIVIGPNSAALTIGVPLPNRIRFASSGIGIASPARGIDVANNLIADSTVLGIDLGNDGVTPNDPNDVDTGANDLQNHPVISGAQRVAGGLSLTGSLDVGHPGTLTYTLMTYASDACHPSGHGEGERILGQTSRNFSSTAESFSFTLSTSDPLPPGTVITMTATRPGVGTSEFSACFPIDPPPLVVNTTDDVGDGVCNATHCSLRDAIIVSNNASGPGLRRIHFALSPTSGTSEVRIAPATQLPDITRTVAIDGYTQPGAAPNTDPDISNAVIRVRLDGPGGTLTGLRLCAPGIVVRGLSITRFSIGIESCTTGTSTVVGNFLGLAADGVTAAANSIALLANGGPVDFGGSAPADRNVVGGAALGLGIGAEGAAGSQVDGNMFGSDRTGTQARGPSTGLFINAGAGSIGIGARRPNIFRFSTDAISLAGNAGTNIRFDQNIFASLTRLAVDLGADGVTTNDPGDGDTGTNGLLNFPVLDLVERTDAGLRVVGALDVPAGVTTVTVYASANCHSSGHGPGQHILGTFAPPTFSFDHALATDVDLAAFPFITATASSVEGTSEMSSCRTVTDPPPGIAVDTSDDQGAFGADGGCETTGDANTCTLSEAITLANSRPGTDMIRFAIPGEGPHVIDNDASFPAITDGLLIDGYTQQGAAPNAAATTSDAVIQIELRVNGAVPLRVCTSQPVELRGLAIYPTSAVAITTSCSLAGLLTVRGSWIGFTATGDVGGGAVGIDVQGAPVVIGGPALADRNVFGHLQKGLIVRDQADGSSIVNNVFGRDPGSTQSATLGTGIELVGTRQVTVGGEGVLANRFSGGTTAILVSGADADFNSLYGNTFAGVTGGTAIDLSAGGSADGITPNDVNDVDAGANEGQNTPVLTDGTAESGNATINGLLDVPTGIAAPVNYRLAFYFSALCFDEGGILGDRNGNIYLGAVDLPFASSAENFSATLQVPDGPGFITATATSPSGSTSEISNCLVAPQPVAVFADGFE
jgi:CSLREA domain-containing protein